MSMIKLELISSSKLIPIGQGKTHRIIRLIAKEVQGIKWLTRGTKALTQGKGVKGKVVETAANKEMVAIERPRSGEYRAIMTP